MVTGAPAAAPRSQAADRGAAPAEKKILFAHEPAILVLIDGEPVYRPLKGTDLQRITNTKVFIVRTSAGIHYLKVLDGWMQAYGLVALWSPAGVAPRGAQSALNRLAATRAVDLLAGDVPGRPGERLTLDGGAAPAIFVSTTPAELIVIDGPARYARLGQSLLEYVDNTTATVFKEPTDDELYVLTSDGWFRAWRTDGPWQFVPRTDLPADIAAIPDDSPVWHRTLQRVGEQRE
jgi:hypothetical protein